MQKLIICNLDLLRIRFTEDPDIESDLLRSIRGRILAYLKLFIKNGNYGVWFFSHNTSALIEAEEKMHELGYDEFVYVSRNDAKLTLLSHIGESYKFVIVGSKDQDLFLAVNTKVLFIVPTWIPIEDKAIHYGVHVDSAEQLNKFILSLNNQKKWYAMINIDRYTTALSLMDGRYKYRANSNNEKEMLEHFERLLKTGTSRNYYSILMYHFLAGITNSDLFDDIELFGMIPSSDCNFSPDIYKFVQQVRYIKGKKIPKNAIESFLVRKKSKNKAHYTETTIRKNMGCAEEFKTLCINPEYREKIEKLKKSGKLNVCVFDDYMTHGNTFNAVRNLLNHIGANKIVFVSFGNFGYDFQKRDYAIDGDVYNIGYTYQEVSYHVLPITYNNEAKEEVSELYNIFNL